MFRFETLTIWSLSVSYVNEIYLITKNFPKTEIFSLTDQLRRSASSIPANIAEGSGSDSKKDFGHFINIAIRSLYETVSHLHIAKNQGYITEEERMSLYSDAEILIKQMKRFKSTLL